MFLLITGSRFPFYSFRVKAFPQSIFSFIQLPNKYLYNISKTLSSSSCALGGWETFLLSKDLCPKFCLADNTYLKLPRNMIQSRRYLLKAHYVLGTGKHWEHKTKLKAVGLPVQWGNRCMQVILLPWAQTCDREMSEYQRE